METATVRVEGDHQTVHLPISYHISSETVMIRRAGNAIILEPLKPNQWPPGFFEKIHIADPAFKRPEQGSLPEIKKL
jgi:virulence-associated protein VagC